MREELQVRVGANIANFESAMGRITSIAKKAAMGITAAFTTSTYIGSRFEQQLMETATVAQAFGKDLEALEKKARSLGGTTAFTATEAAQGMYSLASAGLKTNEIITATEDAMKLAGATGSEMSQATGLLAASMKQFGLEAEDSRRITDTYAAAITNSQLTMERLTEAMKYAGTTGGSLKWSIEETTAAVAQFANLGLEGSMAGTNLRMAMLDLVKPTDDAKQTLRDLGLSIEDISPTTHNFAEILEILAKTTFDVDKANMIFTKRSATNMAMLVDNFRKGKIDIEAFTNTLLESQKGIGRTAEMYNRMMDTFRGQWKILLSALQELAITFFKTYRNEGKELFTSLAESVNNLAKYINENKDVVKRFYDGFLLLGKLTVVGGSLYGLNAFFIAFPKMVNAATTSVYAFRMSLLSTHATSILLAGSLNSLKAAGLVLFAAFAGWKIGEYLYKNFETARLAGLALIDGLMRGWIHFKYFTLGVFSSIGRMWNTTTNEIKKIWIDFLEGVAKSTSYIPLLDKFSGALQNSVDQLRKTIKTNDEIKKQGQELAEQKKKELNTHNAYIESIRQEHTANIDLLIPSMKEKNEEINKIKDSYNEVKLAAERARQAEIDRQLFLEALKTSPGVTEDDEYEKDYGFGISYERMQQEVDVMQNFREMMKEKRQLIAQDALDIRYRQWEEEQAFSQNYVQTQLWVANTVGSIWDSSMRNLTQLQAYGHKVVTQIAALNMNMMIGAFQTMQNVIAAVNAFVGSESKAMFIVMRAIAAAIAFFQGLLAAISAAASAAAIPFVGWIIAPKVFAFWATLAAVNAAAILATGIAQAFSSPSTGGSVATPSTNVNAYATSGTINEDVFNQAEEPEDKKPTLEIHFHGDVLAEDYMIERLVEKITDAVETKNVRLISSGVRT